MVDTPKAMQEFPLGGHAVVTDSQAHFLATYEALFEHSPWVVERTWPLRPFPDAEALHGAFRQVLSELSIEDKLRLIRAHPELADRVAIAQGLTDSSATEQATAGLDRLTIGDFGQFQALNAAYRSKFAFPFIICARLYGKDQILSAMRVRLQRSPAEELGEAIGQISQIVRLRLWTLLAA
jgi:2-oxo-4-hydroxy-4-carboxy-5-ureidoimidazoline decarboxylase